MIPLSNNLRSCFILATQGMLKFGTPPQTLKDTFVQFIVESLSDMNPADSEELLCNYNTIREVVFAVIDSYIPPEKAN